MTLRRFNLADANRALEIIGEDGLAMLTPSSLDMARAWINSHDSPLNCVRAICNEENMLVGAISLTLQKNASNAELGFWVDTEYWGRGIASQAVSEMIAHGFTVLRLHRIFGKHYSNNPASGRVMEKAGMTVEGELREEKAVEGVFYNLVYYSILEHEHHSLALQDMRNV